MVTFGAGEWQELEWVVRRWTVAPQMVMRAQVTVGAIDGLHSTESTHHMGIDVEKEGL
jgi:hypothetical protein